MPRARMREFDRLYIAPIGPFSSVAEPPVFEVCKNEWRGMGAFAVWTQSCGLTNYELLSEPTDDRSRVEPSKQ